MPATPKRIHPTVAPAAAWAIVIALTSCATYGVAPAAPPPAMAAEAAPAAPTSVHSGLPLLDLPFRAIDAVLRCVDAVLGAADPLLLTTTHAPGKAAAAVGGAAADALVAQSAR